MLQLTRCHRYVDYCLSRIELLQSHTIRPVLVFDGGNLPMKADKESERRQFVVLCLGIAGAACTDNSASQLGGAKYF